jgi:hypothetical protein
LEDSSTGSVSKKFCINDGMEILDCWKCCPKCGETPKDVNINDKEKLKHKPAVCDLKTISDCKPSKKKLNVNVPEPDPPITKTRTSTIKQPKEYIPKYALKITKDWVLEVMRSSSHYYRGKT